MIVKPVLAIIAFNHELVDVLEGMRLLAVAVAIEEILVVVVGRILKVILLIHKLARERHSSVSTITFEIQFGI